MGIFYATSKIKFNTNFHYETLGYIKHKARDYLNIKRNLLNLFHNNICLTLENVYLNLFSYIRLHFVDN